MNHARAFFALVLTLGCLVLSAGPTFGQSSTGTVTANVTVVTACIQLSAASFSYGNATFSTAGTDVKPTSPASPALSFTNCSSVPENVFVMGANATSSSGPSTTWDLIDPGGTTICSLAPPNINKYAHQVNTSATQVVLSNAQKPLASSVPASQVTTFSTVLTMPCTGSGGSGQTMNMPITFTAALS